MILLDKQTLRILMKEKRNKLTFEQRLIKSNQIVEKLIPFLHGTVALYQPFGSEVMLPNVEHACLQYALPCVTSLEEMVFYYIDNKTVYKKSIMGIFEPNNGIIALPQDFDVIIVPMVAFDSTCHRMGYGRGYYDRYLVNTKALRIGVAFECQKTNALIIESFDQPLDYILTEDHIYKAER